MAEPMPTKPPPFLKYASKIARCASVRGLAMPVLRNTTARYASNPAAVNSAPTAAGAGAVTVKSPLLAALLIAARPAGVAGSVLLVTTSTFAGAAGFGFRFADAVAGATRARLARAKPRVLLLPILLLLVV